MEFHGSCHGKFHFTSMHFSMELPSKSMVFHGPHGGVPWRFHGEPWVSMDIIRGWHDGSPWTSMHFHGIPMEFDAIDKWRRHSKRRFVNRLMIGGHG